MVTFAGMTGRVRPESTVKQRQQVDERPAAARVNERHGRHIGDQVAVEIAESNQIAYQSGAYLLRRTLTVFDRSLPLAESNQAFLVAA